ncbi:MAG: hypothetical protein GY856_07650, partial [bacterium]|nr:hypothetical protein [bacterium]
MVRTTSRGFPPDRPQRAQDEGRLGQGKALVGRAVGGAEELGFHQPSFLDRQALVVDLAAAGVDGEALGVVEVDLQVLLGVVLEAHAGRVLAAAGGESVAPADGDGAGAGGGKAQFEAGGGGGGGGEPVADQPQVLDDAAPRLGGPQEALVGDSVLVVAQDVAHVGEELEQDVAEVDLG